MSVSDIQIIRYLEGAVLVVVVNVQQPNDRHTRWESQDLSFLGHWHPSAQDFGSMSEAEAEVFDGVVRSLGAERPVAPGAFPWQAKVGNSSMKGLPADR